MILSFSILIDYGKKRSNYYIYSFIQNLILNFSLNISSVIIAFIYGLSYYIIYGIIIFIAFVPAEAIQFKFSVLLNVISRLRYSKSKVVSLKPMPHLFDFC